MRMVVQRVTRASVTVDGEVTGKIGKGYMVLVGAEVGDTEADARLCADKLAGLRVFVDDEGKMNRSVLDVGGEILLVSQFTLLGDARHGRRPSFIAAARRFSMLMDRSEAQRKSYLLITVRNRAIDLLRWEGRYTGLEESEPLPGGLSGEQAAVAAAGYDALVELILSMPPTYREVLERRLILEETPEEAAAAMGLSRQAVNARFARGRKLLRDRLLEERISP